MMTRSTLAVWIYMGGLMSIMAFSLFSATPFPQDDYFSYQQFVEALARGRLDLSIPGFHGSDIFAVPWYLLSRSPIAQIDMLRVWAVSLPLIAYLAGVRLFRSPVDGAFLVSIIAMMPFVSFVALRGWTGPAYWGLMLLAATAAASGSLLVIVPLGLAILTKPFAIALVPLLWVLLRRRRRFRTCAVVLWSVFAFCAAYVAIQYFQAGRIFVGTHADVGILSVFHGGKRFFLNIAHALQMLFSVHNYYFPDPSKTGPGNLLHTSPVLMFLGLYALLSSRSVFTDRRLPPALLLGTVAGFVMNALLDHMDHFYMEAGVLLLIVASIPLLSRAMVWVPIVLATLHFQWFYFFLQYREVFALSWQFFLVPLYIDAAFLLFFCSRWRRILASVRAITLIPWSGRV
ncbi:hypothetical protein HYS30_02435 [Candidatus Peregrinibacteria bacterium]|nr:hypothetical protein [Candidatus Peregrinibacteria bacterium]